MMHCPRCNADSAVVGVHAMPKDRYVRIKRLCTEGHRFDTQEVHPTMVADTRERASAMRAITMRIALWFRDKRIAASSKSVDALAEEHNITKTRVRQIRAAAALAQRASAAKKPGKI